MIVQALTLTLRLAIMVSAILLVIGIPLAYWLAFSRRRWKFLVEAIVSLPIVLPPTVLGFYVLVAVGPFTPLGRWYHALTGRSLAFTFEGLVLGSVLYSLPFAVQPMATSFAAIDRKLLDASALLGASRWRTFWRIVLPLGLPGVLTGAGAELRAHLGRVRCGAHDRRQHSRRNPDRLDSDLRPGASARLRDGEPHCAHSSGALLHHAGNSLRLAPSWRVECVGVEMSEANTSPPGEQLKVRIQKRFRGETGSPFELAGRACGSGRLHHSVWSLRCREDDSARLHSRSANPRRRNDCDRRGHPLRLQVACEPCRRAAARSHTCCNRWRSFRI